MIKPCRYILKGLRQLSTDTEDVLCFLGNTTCFCRYDDYSQTFDYSKYQHEIHADIHQLIMDGYLSPDDPNEERFTITSKGLHPYLFQWEEFKGFLGGVIVGVVTTLATEAAIYLCAKLLQLPLR